MNRFKKHMRENLVGLDMRNERAGAMKNDSQCLGCATVSVVASITKVGRTGRSSGFEGKSLNSVLSIREI